VRTQDIIIGETYRHKDHPTYAYAKVIEKIKPDKAPNTHGYTIFKCEWTVDRNDQFGMIMYFRATDLVKEASK
jgi:hypothetical protein